VNCIIIYTRLRLSAARVSERVFLWVKEREREMAEAVLVVVDIGLNEERAEGNEKGYNEHRRLAVLAAAAVRRRHIRSIKKQNFFCEN